MMASSKENSDRSNSKADTSFSTFFNETDLGKHVPRAIFVDFSA